MIPMVMFEQAYNREKSVRTLGRFMNGWLTLKIEHRKKKETNSSEDELSFLFSFCKIVRCL